MTFIHVNIAQGGRQSEHLMCLYSCTVEVNIILKVNMEEVLTLYSW